MIMNIEIKCKSCGCGGYIECEENEYESEEYLCPICNSSYCKIVRKETLDEYYRRMRKK